MKYLAVVVVMLASACLFPPSAIRESNIRKVLQDAPAQHASVAPPSALQVRPLAIGQWALYKRTRGHTVGYERLTVVAEDGCGVWLDWHRVEPGGSFDALLCFHDQQLVTAIRRGESGTRIRYPLRDAARELPRLAAVARTTLLDGRRDDIEVPDGQFAATIYEKQDGVELWSHPEVPFGGVVRAHEGDTAVELVAFGEEHAHPETIVSLESRLAAAEHSPRGFIAAGMGSTLRSSTIRAGVRASSALDVLLDLRNIDEPKDAMGNQTGLLQVLGGVRWYPWDHPSTSSLALIEGAGLYVQGTLGYTARTRSDADTIDGFGAAAAIGALVNGGRDWLIGVEAAACGGYLGTGDDVHAFTATAQVQLQFDRLFGL